MPRTYFESDSQDEGRVLSSCGIHPCARFSTLALRVGTPNSLRQTSASTATPSRICSCEGLAKHSRTRLPESALSVDHSGHGLMATPAARAAWYSFRV